MGVMYLTASVLHDAIESTASRLLTGGSKAHADEANLRRLSLAADAAAILAGIGGQRLLQQQPHESLGRAGARTAAFWFSAAAFAGLASGLTEETVDTLDDRSDHRYHIDRVPIALVGGAAFAAVREFQRRRKESGYVALKAVPDMKRRVVRFEVVEADSEKDLENGNQQRDRR
jgi:hypothetical protein